MTEARNNFKAIFDSVDLEHDEYNYMQQQKINYETRTQKEIEYIGKIGFNSKSFIDDDEDYTKW